MNLTVFFRIYYRDEAEEEEGRTVEGIRVLGEEWEENTQASRLQEDEILFGRGREETGDGEDER